MEGVPTGAKAIGSLNGDPYGALGGMRYLADEFFPVDARAHLIVVWTGSIKPNQWAELVEKCRTGHLRQVAKEYHVLHQAVRGTVQRIGIFDLVQEKINMEYTSMWIYPCLFNGR